MYFLRTSTKRTLGEETFQVIHVMMYISSIKLMQREIMAGLINASLTQNLLWNIERTFSNILIPFMNSKAMADRNSEDLLVKVKKELLPCLRSFARWQTFRLRLLLMLIFFLVHSELQKRFGQKEFS